MSRNGWSMRIPYWRKFPATQRFRRCRGCRLGTKRRLCCRGNYAYQISFCDLTLIDRGNLGAMRRYTVHCVENRKEDFLQRHSRLRYPDQDREGQTSSLIALRCLRAGQLRRPRSGLIGKDELLATITLLMRGRVSHYFPMS